MACPVGFVVLTHNKPKQLVRLITTLNRMFERPPIACHHDFTKCNLASEAFPKNVSFVHPHISTGWARFSVVEAMLRAIQLLYELPNFPNWFILLSGADYPIKSAKRILDDLFTSKYDAHIEHQRIIYNNYENAWQEACHKRYCSLNLHIPLINRVAKLRHPLLTRSFLPFSHDFGCFAGEFWFCGNVNAAKHLIEYHRTRPALAAHYRRSERHHNIFPEESYFQTILCNSPNLSVSQNNWRYIDWSSGPSYPKLLLLEDLPKLKNSSAHFARKFDIDADDSIFSRLDDLLY